MPWVEIEPKISASERAKTVHALDRSATVTGIIYITFYLFLYIMHISVHRKYRNQ
jgi:hypothetical protein